MKSEVVSIEPFVDNPPNAVRVISSLRHLDYSNVSAIADIVDNSIDAHATMIWVDILSGPDHAVNTIRILDNGTGMDRDTLDEALRLGSDTEKNPAFDLGLYGMGLITASISLGQRVCVRTLRKGGELYESIQDIEFIVRKKRFVKTLDVLSDTEQAEFEETLVERQVREQPALTQSGKKGDLTSSANRSGTLVEISKIDHCEWRTAKAFSENLGRFLGQTFRKFIQSGKTNLYLNGMRVNAVDPINDFEPTILNEETLKFPQGDVHLKIVELRDYGQGPNVEKSINYANQGFYVLRNNREVLRHSDLGVYTKHPATNLLRIEFSYPATMDAMLSSGFTKQKIQLPQDIKNKVEQACNPYIKQVRNRTKEKETDKEVRHEDFSEAEKYITQKVHLLKTPKAEVEERGLRNGPTEGWIPAVDQHGPRLNISKRKRISLDSLKVSFRHKQLDERGPVYVPDMERDTVVIYWNTRHPFYTEFLAPYSGNKDILNPICFFVYAMACAELEARANSDSEIILENIRYHVASNLAVLLRS